MNHEHLKASFATVESFLSLAFSKLVFRLALLTFCK